jgi:hypothetical protein
MRLNDRPTEALEFQSDPIAAARELLMMADAVGKGDGIEGFSDRSVNSSHQCRRTPDDEWERWANALW